jgi:hypothetical protein
MNELEFDQITAQLKAEQSKYLEAVGRFVLAWAEAEAHLYRVLLHYAKVDEAIGRSIFTGARARTMIEMIERISVNTGMPKEQAEHLRYLFAQMGTINTMRDRVAHHGELTFVLFPMEHGHEGYQFIHNKQRAARAAASFIHKLDQTTFLNMTIDLSKVREGLTRHVEQPFSLEEGWRAATTWLYIFPQPEGTKAASAPTAQKRQRQQRPSRPK